MAKSPLPPKPDDDTDFSVSLSKAQDPLVLALDVGSTATRGSLHDAHGVPVRGYRHKLTHSFTTAPDGTSIIDPDQVVEELGQIIDVVIGSRKELVGRVAGVAIDTFAASLVGIDGRRHATTPCYTYADTRSAPQLKQLKAEHDEHQLQQLTGTRLHTSYLAPRLRWLRHEHSEIFAATKRWISLGEYFHIRLLGKARAGTSVAAWTGLQDRHTGNWSDRMLELAHIDHSHLSLIARPTQPIQEVPAAIIHRWPALKNAKWFAPIADGLAQNVGSGGHNESTVVASLATSGALRVLMHTTPETVPAGLWCYRVDDNRHLLGGAINDVGRALAWAENTFRLPDTMGLADVATTAYTRDVPVFLPYLTGERSTGWVTQARGHAAGITSSTTAQDMVRAVMEGVVLSLGRVAEQVYAATSAPQRLVTTGGVCHRIPGIQQLLADCLGQETIQTTFKRSTLRGTAVMALEVLAPEIPLAQPPRSHTFKPKNKHRDYWRTMAKRYQREYSQLVSV